MTRKQLEKILAILDEICIVKDRNNGDKQMTASRLYKSARIEGHKQQCYACTRVMLFLMEHYPNAYKRHQKTVCAVLKNIENNPCN